MNEKKRERPWMKRSKREGRLQESECPWEGENAVNDKRVRRDSLLWENGIYPKNCNRKTLHQLLFGYLHSILSGFLILYLYVAREDLLQPFPRDDMEVPGWTGTLSLLLPSLFLFILFNLSFYHSPLLISFYFIFSLLLCHFLSFFPIAFPFTVSWLSSNVLFSFPFRISYIFPWL